MEGYFDSHWKSYGLESVVMYGHVDDRLLNIKNELLPVLEWSNFQMGQLRVSFRNAFKFK